MTITTNSNVAIDEILRHDDYIGSVLDCASDIKSLSSKTVDNAKDKVYGGIENRHEYRMMRSAQHSEEDWTAFAERYGLKEVPTYHPQSKVEVDDKTEVKCKIKTMPKNKTYVKSTKVNDRMVKAFIYRLKLEDDLDIAPINNPYIGKDSEQLIKIVGFEYHKPILVIRAISADDEHDRLTQTRSMDEVSEFYFTFTIATNTEGKEHPDMAVLRRFIWTKVDHSGKVTLASLLRQLIDRVVTISLNPQIERKGKMIPNPDFIGFPTYDVDSRIDESSKDTCDHIGSYSNLALHRFHSATNSQLIAD